MLKTETNIEKMKGGTLYEYESYEQYKEEQTKLNHRKITWGMWDPIENIKGLSEYLNYSIGPINKGLCHGTRRGEEQKAFSYFLGATVWGTEISDTATQFPFTVEWDFHDQKEEWKEQMDFVYSNSLDQAFDPQKALVTWLEQLNNNGVLILAHGKGHEPDHASIGDPFGGYLDDYKTLIELAGGKLVTMLRFGRNDITHLIVTRADD